MEDSKVSPRSGIKLAKILTLNVSRDFAVNFREGCFKSGLNGCALFSAHATNCPSSYYSRTSSLSAHQNSKAFALVLNGHHDWAAWLPFARILGLGRELRTGSSCVVCTEYCITQNVSRSGGSASTNLYTVRVQPPVVCTSPDRGNFALKESRDSGRGVKFDSSPRLLFLRLRMAQEILASRILSPCLPSFPIIHGQRRPHATTCQAPKGNSDVYRNFTLALWFLTTGRG